MKRKKLVGLQNLVRYSRVYVLSESIITKFYCSLIAFFQADRYILCRF